MVCLFFFNSDGILTAFIVFRSFNCMSLGQMNWLIKMSGEITIPDDKFAAYLLYKFWDILGVCCLLVKYLHNNKFFHQLLRRNKRSSQYIIALIHQ